MFVISEKHLSEDNLEVIEFLSLLVLDGRFYQVLDDKVLISLQDKGLIKIGSVETCLREEGLNIINKYVISDFNPKTKKVKTIFKKSARLISDEVSERIDEYRNVFKGLKTGSMGDPKSCKEKLSRWMSENPSVSLDRIIKAAQVYVGSVENMRYLQRADYFIYKMDNVNKEEISTLSSIIDEVTDKTIINNDDWTSKIN